jgi:hypothetical protein
MITLTVHLETAEIIHISVEVFKLCHQMVVVYSIFNTAHKEFFACYRPTKHSSKHN